MNSIRIPILAAALTAGLTAAATTQALAAPECSGELTIDRLAQESCMSRIPLPTPRPDTASAAAMDSDSTERLTREDFTYVTSMLPDGHEREARVVGVNFLPPENEDMNLRSASLDDVGMLNRAFMTTLAYMGIGSAFAGEAEVASGERVDENPQVEASVSGDMLIAGVR